MNAIMKCCRLDCQESLFGTITLKVGEDEKTYCFCLYHYLQCLAVIRGIEIITNGEMVKEVTL